MSGETIITVVGNLVDDPELRFTPSGAAVCNFRIASTPRVFDKQSNDWKDGDALFLGVNIWRQAAENVAESLQKGMRVVVQGVLKSRQYETREGEKRTVFEITAEEVAPSLKYATAKVTRTSSNGGGGGQQQRPQGGQQSNQGGRPAQGGDPWGAPAGGQSNDPWGAPAEEPPF
jgi:single-strand DNA-binding protein